MNNKNQEQSALIETIEMKQNQRVNKQNLAHMHNTHERRDITFFWAGNAEQRTVAHKNTPIYIFYQKERSRKAALKASIDDESTISATGFMFIKKTGNKVFQIVVLNWSYCVGYIVIYYKW